MTLTVDLPEEIGRRLRAEAARTRTDEAAIAIWLFREQFSEGGPLYALSDAKILSLIESQGLPEAFWQRYGELLPRSWEKTLSESERQEFLSLNRQLETLNSERARMISALALRRGVPLPDYMEQTGIKMLMPPEPEVE